MKNIENYHSCTSLGQVSALVLVLGVMTGCPTAFSQELYEGVVVPDFSMPQINFEVPVPLRVPAIRKDSKYSGDTSLYVLQATTGTPYDKQSGIYATGSTSLSVTSDSLLRIQSSSLKLIQTTDSASILFKAQDLQFRLDPYETFMAVRGPGAVRLEALNNLVVKATESLDLMELVGGSAFLTAGNSIFMEGNAIDVTHYEGGAGTLTLLAQKDIWLHFPDITFGESALNVSTGAGMDLNAGETLYIGADLPYSFSWLINAAHADHVNLKGDSVYLLRFGANSRVDLSQDAVWAYESPISIEAEKAIYVGGAIDNINSDISINSQGKAQVALLGNLRFQSFNGSSVGKTVVNFGKGGLFDGAVLATSSSIDEAAPLGQADLTFGQGSRWIMTESSRVANLTATGASIDFQSDRYIGLAVDHADLQNTHLWVTFNSTDLGQADYLQVLGSAEGQAILNVHSTGFGDGTNTGPIVVQPYDSSLKVSLGSRALVRGVPVVDLGNYLYTLDTETVDGKKYTYLTPYTDKDNGSDDADDAESEGGSETPSQPPASGEDPPAEGQNPGSSDKDDSTASDKDESSSDSPEESPEIGEPVPPIITSPAEELRLSPSAFAFLTVGSSSLDVSLYQGGIGDLSEHLTQRLGSKEDGLFAQLTGSRERIRTLLTEKVQNHYSALRFGVDRKLNSDLSIGAELRLVNSRQKANGEFSVARGRLNTQSLQLFSNWEFGPGWYTRGIISLIRADQTVQTTMLDGTFMRAKKTKPGLGASFEVGRKVMLSDTAGLYVIPQAQLSALWVKSGSFSVTNGMEAEQKNISSLTGRVGALLGQTVNLKSQSCIAWRLGGGVKKELKKQQHIILNNQIFEEPGLGSRLYTSADIDWSRKTLSSYVKLQAEKGRRITGWQVSAGLQWRF